MGVLYGSVQYKHKLEAVSLPAIYRIGIHRIMDIQALHAQYKITLGMFWRFALTTTLSEQLEQVRLVSKECYNGTEH